MTYEQLFEWKSWDGGDFGKPTQGEIAFYKQN